MDELRVFRYYLGVGEEKYEIPHAPRGWEDTMVGFQRDKDYHSINREFSIPMDFVLSASKFLKKILFTKGVDADVKLIVEKLDRRTMTYHLEYQGDLDFSQADASRDVFEINIMKSGLDAMLKARKNIEYEFNFKDSVLVELPGIDISGYANSSVAVTTASTPAIDAILNEFRTFRTSLSNSFLPLGEFSVYDQEEEWKNGSFIGYNNYFLKSNRDGNFQLRLEMDVNIRNQKNNNNQVTAFWEVVLISIKEGGGVTTTSLYSSEFQENGDNILISIDKQIEANTNEVFFLALRTVRRGAFYIFDEFSFETNEATTKVYTTNLSDPVVCRAFKPIDLYSEIMQRVDSSSLVESNLLTNSNILITSGSEIRGLQNAKLKTSFNKFYRSMNALFCIGQDLKGYKATIEKRDYFYRQQLQMADVGEVKNLVIRPYTEELYSSIKTGYTDQTYEEENGLFEFNSEQEWETTTKRSTKPLDLMSDYRADQFGIEELRIKQLEENTDNETDTDSKDDNTVFILKIKGEIDGVYQVELAEDFEDVEGVFSRSFTYNLGISPKRNMLHHIPYIASSFYGINNEGDIAFTSAKKNADLSSKINGETVVEKGSIPISDVKERFFIPFIAEFSCNYPKNIQKMIEENGLGFISFSFNDVKYKGYILEVSVDLVKESEQEFKLLLLPDTDLSKLY